MSLFVCDGIARSYHCTAAMATTEYTLAVDHWRDTDTITIRSKQGQLIASFPVAFLQKGGDNTWGYILSVVEQLVEHPSGQTEFITDHNGEHIDVCRAPSKGDYIYVNDSM
jgi:hypothetical protein